MSMTRRSWVKGAIAGASLGFHPLLSAAAGVGSDARRLMIDGLSIAFSLSGDVPVPPADLRAIRASGLSAINMTTPRPGDDFGAAVVRISRLQDAISRHREDLLLVRRADDIQRAQRQGRLGIIIGFQSTEMFDDSLQAIDVFHGLGARIMQMSYNGPGLFGHGCLSESGAGLTETGHRAVAHMNARGVLIDASHANKQTTADAIAASTYPVVISHTGCNAVYAHPRNNDDAELRALAERGGVAGIYLMPFLDGGSGELTSGMLMAHLDHALQVCGEDHVGVGSDQGVTPVDDGPEYRRRLREEVERRRAAGISAPGESAERPPFIPALNHADRMIRIAELMAANGYAGRIIDKVIGANFLRVMRESWAPGDTKGGHG